MHIYCAGAPYSYASCSALQGPFQLHAASMFNVEVLPWRDASALCTLHAKAHMHGSACDHVRTPTKVRNIGCPGLHGHGRELSPQVQSSAPPETARAHASRSSQQNRGNRGNWWRQAPSYTAVSERPDLLSTDPRSYAYHA